MKEGVEESKERERREWDRGDERVIVEEKQKQGEDMDKEESRERGAEAEAEVEEAEEKEEKWSTVPLRRSKRVQYYQQHQQKIHFP